MSSISIENFLNEEYSQTALYASFRSIASYIDGLKPSSRKVVHTLKKKNITTDIKVSRLSAIVSEQTEFLHGEGSLQSVISNMAQTFTGSNNDALLYPSGSFGTRFVPIPSAPRYIFTRKSESFDKYFKKEDDGVLIEQEFEGTIIEPKFFVPILPLLLINGSEGIGTGFAQKILSRNPEEIKLYIKAKLSEKPFKGELKPFYSGFIGDILPSETGGWKIIGKYEIINSTTIKITELPIGYTLASYNKILDDLEDKKIIKSFDDISEEDKFLFMVNVSREFTKQNSDNILEALKLVKRVSENLTCVDENNQIREFSSIQEILDAFIKIRLEYYTKRKIYLIEQYKEEIRLIESKALFIDKIIKQEIFINNRSKKDIENQLDDIKNQIIKIDDSYDYLLKMPLWSLTKERYEDLIKAFNTKKEELEILEKTSEKSLWQKDITKE